MKNARTIALALIGASGLLLAACGQGAPAGPQGPQTVRVTAWAPSVPETAITQGAEAVTISATASPSYQAQHEVATGGARTMLLRWDVTMSSGPGYLGVLAGDGNSWLASDDLPPDQRTTGELEVPLSGERVFLVFQTAPDTRPGAVFTVHNVEYTLR